MHPTAVGFLAKLGYIGELRVAELRIELEKRNLDSKGLKGTLVQRLQEAIKADGGNPNEVEIEEVVTSPKVSQRRGGRKRHEPEENKIEPANVTSISDKEVSALPPVKDYTKTHTQEVITDESMQNYGTENEDIEHKTVEKNIKDPQEVPDNIEKEKEELFQEKETDNLSHTLEKENHIKEQTDFYEKELFEGQIQEEITNTTEVSLENITEKEKVLEETLSNKSESQDVIDESKSSIGEISPTKDVSVETKQGGNDQSSTLNEAEVKDGHEESDKNRQSKKEDETTECDELPDGNVVGEGKDHSYRLTETQQDEVKIDQAEEDFENALKMETENQLGNDLTEEVEDKKEEIAIKEDTNDNSKDAIEVKEEVNLEETEVACSEKETVDIETVQVDALADADANDTTKNIMFDPTEIAPDEILEPENQEKSSENTLDDIVTKNVESDDVVDSSKAPMEVDSTSIEGNLEEMEKEISDIKDKDNESNSVPAKTKIKKDNTQKTETASNVEVDVLDMLDYDIEIPDGPNNLDDAESKSMEKYLAKQAKEQKESKTSIVSATGKNETGEKVDMDSKKEKAKSASSDSNSTTDKKTPVATTKSTEIKNDKEVLVKKNLWISGLSSVTRASELKSAFSRYGKVTSAKVVTNAKSPGSRCYGYVSMNNEEAAAKCILHLNETEMHGRLITVEIAKSDPSAPSKKTVTTPPNKSVNTVKASGSAVDNSSSGERSEKKNESQQRKPQSSNRSLENAPSSHQSSEKSNEAQKPSMGSHEQNRDSTNEKSRVGTRPGMRNRNERQSNNLAQAGSKRAGSRSPVRRSGNREGDLRDSMPVRKRPKQPDNDRKVVIDTNKGELRVNVNSDRNRRGGNKDVRRGSVSPVRSSGRQNNSRGGRGDVRNRIGAGNRNSEQHRPSPKNSNTPLLSFDEMRARREREQRNSRRDLEFNVNAQSERDRLRREREEREKMLRQERERLERERKALERDKQERERLEQERLRVELERKRELERIEREKAEMRRLQELNRIEIEHRQRAIKRSYDDDDYSSTNRNRPTNRSSGRDGYETKRAMVSSDRDSRVDSKRDDRRDFSSYNRDHTAPASSNYNRGNQSGGGQYRNKGYQSPQRVNIRRTNSNSHQDNSRYNNPDTNNRHNDKYSRQTSSRSGNQYGNSYQSQTSPDTRRVEPRKRSTGNGREERKLITREDDTVYRNRERTSSARIEITRVQSPIRRDPSPPVRRRDRSPVNDNRWRDSKTSSTRRDSSNRRDDRGDLREEIRGSRQSSSTYNSSDRDRRRRSNTPERSNQYSTRWPETEAAAATQQLYAVNNGHPIPTQTNRGSTWQNPLTWTDAASATTRNEWIGAALQASIGRPTHQNLATPYVAPSLSLPPSVTTIIPAQQSYSVTGNRQSRSVSDRFPSSQYSSKSINRRY